MNITSDQIKALREKTGISVMQCKKALEEAEGDEAKAMIILKKKGAEQAAKKADREFGAGIVEAYIHSNGLVGSIIELASETDFVSNNAEFKTLAKDIAMQVTATAPEFLRQSDIDETTAQKAKELFTKEIVDKPAEMQEKILQGKMDSYFKDQVLLNQDFIKNPEVTIQTMLDTAMQKFGERIEIIRFKRFEIGK
ncbi:elongation factor Ts [Arenimonas sp.]|nr:elongation factor Ts [Candidatus Parcubacteria bacterium]